MAASCLLVLYAVFAVCSGAFVRCHEADGSTHIEWRGAGCCAHEPARDVDFAPDARVSAGDRDADCDGCRDEAFTDGEASAASVRRPQVPADDAQKRIADVACAVPLDRGPRIASASAATTRAPVPPIPPPRLAALRTVVLRC
jgi:hypothetical protein